MWYKMALSLIHFYMTANMGKPSQQNKSPACNIFELPHYFLLEPKTLSKGLPPRRTERQKVMHKSPRVGGLKELGVIIFYSTGVC